MFTLIGINCRLIYTTHVQTKVKLAFTRCHSLSLIRLHHARLLNHRRLLLCIRVFLVRNSLSESRHNHHICVGPWSIVLIVLSRHLIWLYLGAYLRTVVHHLPLLLFCLIRRKNLHRLLLKLHGLLRHLALQYRLLNRHSLLLYRLLHHHGLLLSWYTIPRWLLLLKLLLGIRINRQTLLSLQSDILLGLGTCPLRALIHRHFLSIWVVLLGRSLLRAISLRSGLHHLLLCHHWLLASWHHLWLRNLPSLSRHHTLVSRCDSSWHYRRIILGLDQHLCLLSSFLALFVPRFDWRSPSKSIQSLLVVF